MKKETKSKQPKEETVNTFKGTDKDIKCRSFQYEPGKEYEEKDAKACETGFHACENPLDIFNYYPPTNGNRYFNTESSGKIDRHNEDSKIASSKIKIGLELNLSSLIKGAVKFIFEKTNASEISSATTGYGANSATTGYGANSATTGYGANSATTGEYANSATTGNRANSATTGYGANSATTGEYCISACLNAGGKAKAALGSFIVISEWERDNLGNWNVIDVKGFKVDGKSIQADTFYTLVKGEAKEVL